MKPHDRTMHTRFWQHWQTKESHRNVNASRENEEQSFPGQRAHGPRNELGQMPRVFVSSIVDAPAEKL